ncbi:hypothetical protein ATCC90586_002425 [Pythium insidiosum]|nr:hypothetical protein ATCC90586_002425 [Pythium insidiosum]
MKFTTALVTLVAAAASLVQCVAADANPIAIKSYKFYDSVTGKYFGVRGVDYYPRPNADDEYENAQWFGLNVYLHCDGTLTDATEVGPGFQKLLDDFTSYKMNIPVMLTEFGCLDPSFPTVGDYKAQRTWIQTSWLHSKAFRQEFSGGFVFEYSTELANSQPQSLYPFTDFGPQNYGLGYYSPETCDHEATPCEFVRMPNFDFLAKEYNATNYEDEPHMDSFEASGSKQEFPSCPSSFPSLSDVEWAADSSASLECPEPIEAPLCASGSLVQCVAADANPITIKSYKFYDSVTGKYFGVRGTCDHEATPCEFVRMPNFDFLAKEYNATNYDDESDMNAFKPSRSKQEFPACPPSFADSTTDDTMKLPKALSILCAAILTTIQPTLAITNPVIIKSYKFYDSVTGKYFGVRGVDYYPRPNADAAEVGPGFQKLLDDFTSYKMNIPVMLTEFGCLDPSFPTMGDYKAQRTWIQTTWLHSKEFREEFNGGFIFEYSTELANSQPQSLYPFTEFGPQNYGLGYYSPETCDHQATPCEFVRMPNFDYLAKEHNATNYDDEPEMSAFEPSASKLSFPACPSTFANLKDVEWAADSSPSLQCPDPAVVVTCPADSGGSIVRSNVTKKPTKAPTKAPTRRPDSVKSSSAGSKAATGKTDTAKSPEPASPSDQPRSVANYKFYDSVTGKYFGVRGVDYYPRPNAGELDVNNHDFFTDDHEHIWGPDVSYLAAVGANAVRLYAVDPSKSHHKFMCALRSHGMYAMIDLGANCKDCAITKDKYPACYPDDLKKRGEQIISVFAKYDNVMAFSAGNEVNHVVVDPKDNAPCQKKFIRDMRAFISKCSTIRDIPVGVVLADTDRQDNALYYNCRTNSSDTMENAEWYGLNVYLHCDGKVTDVANAAGFQKLLSDFKSYKMNIPVMLTEFGCLNPSFPTIDGYEAQRTWLQAGWLHSTAFRAEFSGGFVFEYSTENANSKKDSPYPFTKYGEQNYGLGYFSPETCDHATTKCEFKPMPNYGFLAKEYNATKYDDEPLMSAFTPNADKHPSSPHAQYLPS